jgi:hypothetical protein
LLPWFVIHAYSKLLKLNDKPLPSNPFLFCFCISGRERLFVLESETSHDMCRPKPELYRNRIPKIPV